jgi:hypothetical protein
MADENLLQDIFERVTRIEENVRLLRVDLSGNGSPGRLNVLETDVRDLRDAHNRQKGVIAAVSAIVAGVVSVAAHFVKRL